MMRVIVESIETCLANSNQLSFISNSVADTGGQGGWSPPNNFRLKVWNAIPEKQQ